MIEYHILSSLSVIFIPHWARTFICDRSGMTTVCSLSGTIRAVPHWLREMEHECLRQFLTEEQSFLMGQVKCHPATLIIDPEIETVTVRPALHILDTFLTEGNARFY